MPDKIDLIRHGQSTFNEAYARDPVDPLHFDARLTTLGHRQAADARAALRDEHYDLVVTSPFTRAIETTLGIFGDRSDVPILIEALHRERLESSCDVGSTPTELIRRFPRLIFDHLAPCWWHDAEDRDPRGFAIEPLDALMRRTDEFRLWIRGRPEKSIAVIGHGAFFFHLTGRPFANCEIHRWQG